ncbi:MAG: NgoFVII family restriction endonuclease [Candidatus Lindowbacteria bacterium RIFCSPLOWO2_12_FULL_62_27]|nr:MAG: NgoFVII family restriction endonuclease [Candidatus Lindowbacteria bacterium RIFCSPLOWO2_12_FULL_62_27]
MPRIFDNIDDHLITALQQTLDITDRADFCVGYFNLRGWKQLDRRVERWSGGDGHCCRLLVGMQRPPQEELRTLMTLAHDDAQLDNQTVLRIKKKLAQDFRDQLTIGIPTNEDEAGLRRLAAQIKSKKVVVKLFLRHPLHAKLYLLFRPDPINPIVSYLGSSNLTMAGLSKQGELNVDVLDHDACKKLSKWFEDRWNDNRCIDISDELVQIIEESWAREDLIPPYHIYIKMAYHLSQEARAGLTEFRIPTDFGNRLFEFQKAAVKIAAHHINKRGGVLIGDVVGLGKTLMATALARVFEDDFGLETLILCPKNLVSMWEDHRDQYRLHAKVLSISRAIRELPDLRRYRLVIIDESHNLRNREGKRYRAIQEYIAGNDSKCILLSATPYNKTYLDLANQLRLFIPDDHELSIRPEQLLRTIGEIEFIRKHQCPVRSLSAFEKSDYADDWRELMRLYLVRRTRTFIQENYAIVDCAACKSPIAATDGACPKCAKPRPKSARPYLLFEDGTRSHFPTRLPKTVKFKINDKDSADQYARLYDDNVVGAINGLTVPRYGLANYIAPSPPSPPTPTEKKTLDDLSKAGKRLMGFCRTNLFKRLESSGQAFLQSIERHILRNCVYLHAIENNLPLPIGTQDAELLDTRFSDDDEDDLLEQDDEETETRRNKSQTSTLRTAADFKARAVDVYAEYTGPLKRRFKWLPSEFFTGDLSTALRDDVKALLNVLKICGEWDPAKDAKLDALWKLLSGHHQKEKVLVFTQFADTVLYLDGRLRARGLAGAAGVTGDNDDPTALAWRFSPESNLKRGRVRPDDELRVLIATDVLSEGQNLQDAAIVVNYDLPWAIIRLIQRAGRVDRIGQKAENILCYSFLPADGVERIIRLRQRVRRRLKENAEVVGADERFFEDEPDPKVIRDLFTEKAGTLDGDADSEVDLASYAYQIWKNAVTADPRLQKTIPDLPPVVYATRAFKPTEKEPDGALVYMRTGEGNDALAWMDRNGNSVTESQFAILKAAECAPDTTPLPREENHHELVHKAVEQIMKEESSSAGGQLGRPAGARFRTYDRLKHYAEQIKGTLFSSDQLSKAVEDIYRYPLRQTAVDALNRQLRAGISNEQLAEMVVDLREEGRLCVVEESEHVQEPQLICSMGLSLTRKAP